MKLLEVQEEAELVPGGDAQDQAADGGGPLAHGMQRAQANDLTARCGSSPRQRTIFWRAITSAACCAVV
jgi:hypothetical protein